MAQELPDRVHVVISNWLEMEAFEHEITVDGSYQAPRGSRYWMAVGVYDVPEGEFDSGWGKPGITTRREKLKMRHWRTVA